MTHQQFLEQLGEVLETEAPLTGTEVLKELETWDSLAAMSFIALADSGCGVSVVPKDISGCITVNDLLVLVSGGLENSATTERP